MHPADHAYALAGPGKREFERTMSASRSMPKDGLSVVGFYRSHIGHGLDMTEEDRGLIQACFRVTSPVVLLIKPNQNGSTRIRLYSGNDGQALSEFRSSEDASTLPVWLELWHSLSADGSPQTARADDTRILARTLPVRTDPPAIAELADPSGGETRAEPQNAVVSRRFSTRTTVLLVSAAIVLTVFAGYPLFKGQPELKQRTDTSVSNALQTDSGHQGDPELALRVEGQGDDLRLDWNRTAPMLVTATGGMLTVREGNRQQQQVMLDSNLLRTGSVIYRAVHGDVSIRLVLFGKDGATLGESVATYRKPKSRDPIDPDKEAK
jgi:proteasome lid subunit RPN8/RPN11